MSANKLAATVLLAAATLLALDSTAAAAPGDAAPAWQTRLFSTPTVLVPGAGSEKAAYNFTATNVGAAPTSGKITFEDILPAGLTPTEASIRFNDGTANGSCDVTPPSVTCSTEGPLRPGVTLVVAVPLQVAPNAPATLEDQATLTGGGAPQASASTLTAIGSVLAPFDFLPGEAGFAAPTSERDGSPATRAGSHAYQLSVGLGFPSEVPASLTHGSGGGLRDATSDLPPGMIVDPAATALRCTAVQLLGNACPAASQIGLASITTPIASAPQPETSAIYNMIPPPGTPSSFAFNVAGAGAYAHVLGSLRSNGDYGLSGGSTDITALYIHPVLGVRLELWGDPAGADHDVVRGGCLANPGSCQVPMSEQTGTALLSLPGSCPGQAAAFAAHADSWEQPNLVHQASYESADLAGNPVSLSGCGQLRFEPSISLSPTTNLIDSPSGLDVDLHQPQDQELGHRSPPPLREAIVTLPAGMSANPAQAGGLDTCTSAQIGVTTDLGATPIHFSDGPDACPDAAKIGTVEVATPLVAQYTENGSKLATHPETGRAIPRPLGGSVYLAKPFDNPFKSLLAIYLSIDDPKTGTVAKLAGKVITDPATGQLTTVFEENPQLPLEDVRLHLFKGARASLITPLNCATHTTTSDLIPWSAPEGKDAHPSDSFQTSAAPGGGGCPATPEAAPNAPTFTAGTVNPTAGAYSPFVLKLSREDGSARLTGFDTLLPPGLSGKLAGIPACSDSQIAQAVSRSNPEEGILERNAPSCPAASALGTVNVAAGAGPTPIWTQGTAYLAGPYKSAPLSMAVITPAIAGPFDLGTVVVRAALRLNPDTAQVHAVSDPFPTILHGVPLDLRSVAVQLDRPRFTLNPTSCDPMAITGSATSAFGAIAALTTPFQVGRCQDLPFKPRLSLALKGKTKRTSHPTLIANLSAKPGEANIARAQVKLPKAAFLDNSNINTICTRVQFAADACPPGSIYGKASATTPLLDDPLTGPVYLRSSSHQLPDLVVKLKGPAAQPIEVDLVGRTDSIKGALRNTFEAVPDAPVSKFHLELFGGKRGLIELSSGLCRSPKASVQMDGQNGKVFDTNPVVKTSCPKKHKRHKGKHRAQR